MLSPWLGSAAILPFAVCAILTAIGIHDMQQTKHSIRRNYPILANIRFMLEEVRPEIRQYFLESDTDGAPYNRNTRAIAYQRAKHQLDRRPFGTLENVYGDQFEWLAHSITPTHVEHYDFRVPVGGPQCAQPYSLSLFNISAMSFGSLSANAIMALNKGAKLGGFAHDTGEGGYSKYHQANGGDIIWEIGSGYFGCRDEKGHFSPERFAAAAKNPQIKMIEIKLSQGAKPGHGGVLPGAKVSAEIAATRGVPQGVDCVSPAGHSAFSTPTEMVQFIQQLRELSGGKPVGFKLCIGNRWEFAAIVKAMVETGILADFIVIDGKEGGTGAAPLEFTDHVGTPLRDGLVFANNCLVGAGLRDRIRIGASGRIVTAFDIARVLSLGADWCNAARGFMFALGCVQSLSCHTDRCPTGVATQDPRRGAALDVPDKAARVHRFHDSTLQALSELIGAAGLAHPNEIKPSQIMMRTSLSEVKSFADIYTFLQSGELLAGSANKTYADIWAMADAQSFKPA
ncbi:FMN-binding glutamate synthase family protein [Methylovirgula sp. 4M-Z18]|uniref:FMN-binding glutamate synthase family protein n=1 Tax=Methylovirgula sp. 4M-Z18 TaxID=2293567 RepID=UPI001FDED151|nr:FMN-binding glutamate synthase family protein [Methylovirgula sp. 4M-Z18]